MFSLILRLTQRVLGWEKEEHPLFLPLHSREMATTRYSCRLILGSVLSRPKSALYSHPFERLAVAACLLASRNVHSLNAQSNCRPPQTKNRLCRPSGQRKIMLARRGA